MSNPISLPLTSVPAFDAAFSASGLPLAQTTAATSQTTEKPDTSKEHSTESGDTDMISDLGLILVVAGIATVLFKRLKQPVVLGYILAGFLVSPHFGYFPTIVNEANIDFWAELGIIFLLFSLGLEFNFKKLLNVGGSAAVTVLVIVAGMMSTGYTAGQMMGFSNISSLFLGAMLSMSSTTIIMKALNDLNMSHRRFTPQVLAVLIVEDLFAVILMVVLSSIAINNSVSGEALLWSVMKLSFFLILWFLVGVYVIPTFLKKQRRYITDELLLVLSVGLCFMMVIFSTYTGFSSALGAFVMGSILAGTSEAERIEKVISPIKDLFGAIFFVSVGMMVDPNILATYTGPILLLSAIVIVGMIVFGTGGMLITGQPLRIAIESGFALTQIGEFSFIIATLGMSLNVINSDLYPIIVSVSVITTFFTPYFIKLSDPFSRWAEKALPSRLTELINRYSQSSTHNESEMVQLWKRAIKRTVWRIVIYSVVLVSIMQLSRHLLVPLMNSFLPHGTAKHITVAITIAAMSPFLLALCYPSTKKWEHTKLKSSVRSNVPFFAMRLVRIVIAVGFLVYFLLTAYSHALAITIGAALFVLILIYFSKSVRKHMNYIENVFIDNLNERELRRSGKHNSLVSDMHLAYVNVGYNCPFVGERLASSNIGKMFGVNVASIQRGERMIPIPGGSTRIFPGDTLGVVGTDEQIQRLLDTIEQSDREAASTDDNIDIEFTSIVLSATSPVAGKKVSDIDFRGTYSVMLVSIEHSDGTYESPKGDSILSEGDNLWLVGDKRQIPKLS